MSIVRAKILNLLKPVLICLKSQKTTEKIFHDFLTKKFELFCIAHCMGKSSQIWCRMSMNFCECVL